MSLELYSAEVKAFDALWQAWETKRDYELESTFRALDYTSLVSIINHLRSIGLQEIPNAPRLDIYVAGGLRFTLDGEDVIQQYCKDNTLVGKLFSVMLKEKRILKSGASEVDIKEYGLRIKLRHELPLNIDDSRVQDALKKWASLPKAFRYIKRYSFLSAMQKGVQFDASFVRENKKDSRGSYIQATTFTGAQIQKQEVKYEMEIEAMRKDTPLQKSFLVACVIVLRGLQRSYTLTRQSVKNDVIRFMASKTGMALRQERGRLLGFPGAKQVTLRKENIGLEAEAELANIRLGDYNVTDKADGLRCLMVVFTNGKIFLIDQNLNVYGTDRYLEGDDIQQWAGAVLDGEWITHDKLNNSISNYYAFDIYNGRKGEDVTSFPFVYRDPTKPSRHSILTETVAAFTAAKNIPIASAKHKLSIFMKQFRWSPDPRDPTGIFKESAIVLDRVQREDAPYHTDGLIFTPNNDSLPKNGRTWTKQFKWKPASMNSVDFLVLTEKEQSSDGRPTNVDYVQFNEKEPGKLVRCKTLRLFVGSSIDPLRIDPRDTILQKKPLPASDKATGPYRPIEFSVTPTDPFASICRVEVSAGLSADDTIICEETKDPINDRTIVEMVYKPENMPGWRWVPLRVRWDKTELFARGEVGRTMNDMVVATDVWNSIHDPITETMIRTGNMADDSLALSKPAAYYKRKAGQDRYLTGGMTSFHNQYIKDRLLLSTVLRPGSALLDMSVGRAGDLHKWLAAKVGWVLGCDISLPGLIEKEGAYDRYLTQAIVRKGQVPKMIFVHADSSQEYADGSAGLSDMDKGILRCLWGECDGTQPPAVAELEGKAAEGFDVAASMFALHYFFKDSQTLEAVLNNLAASVKVGGHFVGCCTDGDQVATLLKSLAVGESASGSEGDKTLWKITKQYEDTHGVLASDDSGLGKAIDVNFISIGDTHTEYLVSFEYLKARMQAIGFDLLNEEELKMMNVSHSTNLFGESYDMAKAQGQTYGIPPSLQTFSFLSRWFIFKRRAIDASVPEAAAATALVQEEQKGGTLAATGPMFQFYHKSKPKDELKVGNTQWRRALSTYAPFTYVDLKNPTIEYSSLEAALGSAKFQYATDKPELGPQIFSTTGNIHQDTLRSKEKDMDEEGGLMRQKQKLSEMKKLGAKFKKNDWILHQDEVLAAYLQQRYARDAECKKILAAILSAKARLVYYGADELGGTVENDRIEGENKLGKALMKLVNLE